MNTGSATTKLHYNGYKYNNRKLKNYKIYVPGDPQAFGQQHC